jgi:hypothetical protein
LQFRYRGSRRESAVAQLFSLDLIVRMSDSVPEHKPKPQPAGSGGPPKPPKKTARGFEDEPTGGAERDFALRHLLKAFSKRLADPDLSAAERTETQKAFERLKEEIKKEKP